MSCRKSNPDYEHPIEKIGKPSEGFGHGVQVGKDRAHIRRVVKGLMRKKAVGKWSGQEREIFYINPFLFKSGDVKPWLFSL